MSNEREAMARIQAYLNERVPVRGIDQELIHCMNDKELRVSDIAALLAARQSAGATGEEPVGTLSIHRFRKIDSMVNHDFEYYGSLPDGTYRVYVAPIGDNGAKQADESKRVELTEAQWRTIQAPTGNLLFDAGVHSACTRIRELLAADALYSQAERIQALEAKCAELERDRARYQWLRRRCFMIDSSDESVTVLSLLNDEGPTGEFLDDQIDSAIAAQAGSKEAS